MVERGGVSPLPDDNLQRERDPTESDLNRTAQPEQRLKLRILDLALPAESVGAERREPNPNHWSQTLSQPGVLDLGW